LEGVKEDAAVQLIDLAITEAAAYPRPAYLTLSKE